MSRPREIPNNQFDNVSGMTFNRKGLGELEMQLMRGK